MNLKGDVQHHLKEQFQTELMVSYSPQWVYRPCRQDACEDLVEENSRCIAGPHSKTPCHIETMLFFLLYTGKFMCICGSMHIG